MKLYHFTKFDNCIKIISENKLLLSSFKNANDYKELSKKEFEGDKKILDYKYFSTCSDEDRITKLSLQSFSNAMMWYFYGDKHKGVCIEFDQNKIKSITDKIVESRGVIYKNGVTHVDNQTILEYLMEKRECWEGENEYRFIFPNNITCIDGINDCITGLYFGADLERKKWISLSFPENIKLYTMYVDKTDGRLNRLEV